MLKPRSYVLFCFIFLATYAAQAFTKDDASNKADNPASEEKLQQLRDDIANLQSDIEANQEKKSDLMAQLRRHDLRIAKQSRLLHGIEKQLSSNTEKLQQLKRQQSQLNEQSRHHRQQLAQLVNQMYRSGNQDFLRILLNIDHADSLQRQLSYFSYFSRARVQQLRQAQQTQKALQDNEQRTRQQTDALKQWQTQQQAELKQLQLAKRQRGKFLAQLEQTLLSQHSRLTDMRENLANLQKLISGLEQIPEDSEEKEPKRPFASLKGDLDWPVSGGAIIEKFGSIRSGVKRQGILIGASEEQAVYPVAAGKVLYADWLRGFGMLLIIDHGGQYMSLYGRNNALFCDKGDWVNPRQQIASVGNSGSGEKFGLYFELRYKGKAINPKRWFHR